jgi:hypothetical protein
MGSIADIAIALAAVPDQELHALRTTLGGEPVIAPSMFAWLEAAIDWEINRRAGSSHHELPAPSVVIDDGDIECGLVALAILHSSFRSVERVATFLDTTAAALCADAIGAWRQDH